MLQMSIIKKACFTIKLPKALPSFCALSIFCPVHVRFLLGACQCFVSLFIRKPHLRNGTLALPLFQRKCIMASRQTNIILFIIIVALLVLVVYLIFELRVIALQEKLRQSPVSILTTSPKNIHHYKH